LPTVTLEPGVMLDYQIDDFTDPWTTPQTVVFLHGIAESAQAWCAWVPYFARRYRVVRINQRGFGASTPMLADYPWTIAGLADDLAHFAQALGLDSFHLVAAKLGGTIAMKFAAEYPQMLRSLSLVGTPPSPASSLGQVIPAWNDHIRSLGGRSWAQWTMGNRLGSAMPPAGVLWWSELMGATAASTLSGVIAAIPTFDVTADLPRISCPTLVVTTTGSGLGSVEQVRVWQQTIPRSTLQVIDRDSYHVAASDPDLAAPPVLAFVTAQSNA